MRKILPLFLCLLLLSGCGTEAVPEITLPPETVPTVTEAVGLYDPDDPLEAATGGALRCYPLDGCDVSGVLTLDENILLFSPTSNSTHIAAYSGEELYPAGQLEVNFSLFPESASLNRWEGGISFYDPLAMETVVLDGHLREVSRIGAPEELVNEPLLSYDRGTLYYCTGSALRALDLETGISRVLKEMAYDYQDITGLILKDTVIECNISDGSSWQTLYISAETGATLHQAADGMTVQSNGERYYAMVSSGSVIFPVFGAADTAPRCLDLSPEETAYFLPEDDALLSLAWTGDGMTLDHYDLDSCLRTASLTLPESFAPWGFQSAGDGKVWFLNYDPEVGCTSLYCWDTTLSPTGDNTYYGGTYYTEEAPDAEGLAECEAYAQQIGEKYGIEVLVYKDAAAVQPWDYDLEPEHLVGVIQRELELLDRNLGNYPEGFLSTLSQRFEGLTICIVRSLTGTAESGSLDSADGIQFMDGYRACIALAAASNTEYALYHELCHLIDTMVINESGAYDRWDQLNPKDFAYDYDYIANQSRDGSAYLQDLNRSFIDTYSMSFPKEDRARIMEYAMTEGNESYFQSTTMQSKLKLLCEGIREAFGLKKSPETFLWEQYLNTSLAYTK